MYAKSVEQRRKELVQDINYMRENIRTTNLAFAKAGTGVQSLARRTFGLGSKLAREALLSVKEVHKMSKTELKLFHFMLENLDSINIDSAERVELELEKINDSSFEAYFNVLNEIKLACEAKEEKKEVKPKDGINSVLTNGNYSRMVIGLTQTLADVKAFLNYEPEFWEFIKSRLRIVPVPADGAKIMCGIQPILDEDKTLHGFYTLVPEVTDMESAYIALDIYKKAHDMFYAIGMKYTDGVQKPGNVEHMEYRDYLTEKAGKITK